jgi:hypothetical protein
MWLIYMFLHTFLLALVNYIDEYLTANNKLPKKTDIHTRIGGLLLVSTLLTFIGAAVIKLFYGDMELSGIAITLAVLSAAPLVALFGAYFYLLTLYPVYQVLPLFQISSLWLLFIEIAFGGSISTSGLLGIITLMVGAYLLDAGTLKLQVPTKLLLIAIPVTSLWAIVLFMVRVASNNDSVIAITFWQMIATGALGLILFFAVKKYREGFLFRVKKQGKNFLGFSLLNESLSQGAYVFSNLAVAAAPVATYVTAMSGIQSVFLLGLFIFFPQKEKTRITFPQIIAICLIAVGVFLIEGIR